MPELNRIIVVGTSTGGIEALKTVVKGLPADLPAAILIVQHSSADSPNVLDRILGREAALPVSYAQDHEAIRAAHVYLAPADHHLIINARSRMQTTHGPKENRVRPAIDPLFRSAAAAYGPRVVGVILTGFLDDGTAGLWAVKERGGVAIVQNPEEAIAPSMPLNALKHVEVNHCIALERIAPLLVKLAHEPVVEKGGKPVPEKMQTEIKIAQEDNALESGILSWGSPSMFACPECHGVLLQLKEGGSVRFRCHTGHAYSLESLLSELTERMEETLWNGVRATDESVLLLRHMADQLSAHGHAGESAALKKKADEAETKGNRIRQILLTHHTVGNGQTA